MFLHGLHVEASFYKNAPNTRNQQKTIMDDDLCIIWHTLELERKMNYIHEMAEKQKCTAV